MITCPNCNTENLEIARYCQECGIKLKRDLIEENQIEKNQIEENQIEKGFIEENFIEEDYIGKNQAPICPACNQEGLTENIHEGIFRTRYTYQCNICRAVFEKKGDKYKFTKIGDPENPTWQKYGNKTLTFDEWVRVTNGGVSDAEQERCEAQKQQDINHFINELATGHLNLTSTPCPMIMKENETATLVMKNISFLESQSVRQTEDVYGGQSSWAKGDSFRQGGVSSRSKSREELKKTDQGTLVLTNKRLTFLGNIRTIDIELPKIIGIKPFKDGIGSQRENMEKTEYFTGTQNIVLNFDKDGRRISVPINGAVLKAAIMGNIDRL